MKKNRGFFSFLLLALPLLTLPQPLLCLPNPDFEACGIPASCGRLTVKFPFYVERGRQHQPPSCGFPGFGISCMDDRPILNISGNPYVVTAIDYSCRSLRLSYSATCQSLSNLTLAPTTPFRLGPKVRTLFLFYNCNSSFSGTVSNGVLLQNRIGCNSGSERNRSILGMFDDDPLMHNASRACESVVEAPVEVRETGEEMMKRGFELKWEEEERNCSLCEENGGRCGFDYGVYRFKCFCPDRPRAGRCLPPRGSILVISGIILLLLLSITGLLCWVMKRRSPIIDKVKNYYYKSDREIETFIRNYGSFMPKRFTYPTIIRITNSFRDKLGQGGFGSVYKGLLPDGTLVAVKLLNSSKGDGEEFINEVASICRTSHVNIVALLGFCFEGRKRALVYEYMPNGSLDKFIYDEERNLGSERLFSIAIGVARGLEYLHRGCNVRILHFDIKPHNILLDGDLCPKISDFGLSKLCLRRDGFVSMLVARGTIGYIAPEVISSDFGGISHKSDVYSYGMMLIEMVGGRKNTNTTAGRSSELYFPDQVYRIVDQGHDLGLIAWGRNLTPEENEIVRKMAIVGLWCIQADPSRRPSMSRAIEMLDGNVEAIPVPPKPFIFSPVRSLLMDSSSMSSSVLL